MWGNEPMVGCFGSLRSQRKGDLGDRVRGLAQDFLPLPIPPWLQALWGPLELRRCMPVGKEEEKGKGKVCSWEGKQVLGPFS